MEFIYSKAWIIINIVNVFFVFFTIFNGSSRGSWKAWVDAFCGAGVIACLVLMWIFAGWKSMIAGLVLSFIIGAISITPANKLRNNMRNWK